MLVAGNLKPVELELEPESFPRVGRIHGAVEVVESIAALSSDGIHVGVRGVNPALQGELGRCRFANDTPVCVHELLDAPERFLVCERQEVDVGLHRNVGGIQGRCLPVSAWHVGVLVVEHCQMRHHGSIQAVGEIETLLDVGKVGALIDIAHREIEHVSLEVSRQCVQEVASTEFARGTG